MDGEPTIPPRTGPLNRLERPHAEATVAHIAGAKHLPGEVVEHIVKKTEGVPLYVEELTRTILASDILHDTGESYELTGPLASPSIPDTLQESLMARLDRLPQVRELVSCLPKGSDRDQQEINPLEPISADGGLHLLRRFPDSSAIVASATLVDLVG